MCTQTFRQHLDLTVAIPTFNGAERLPNVLDRLRSQDAIDSKIQWEVVVVDNNSMDGTADVLQHYQQRWPETVPLRYLFVQEQGAAFARQAAVEAAKGKWIGFLDDDNWPASDWISRVVDFINAYSHVGAFGSQVHGQFEKPPEFDLKSIAGLIGIIERGPTPFCYTPKLKVLPPTAGLVVRKEAWLQAVPKRLFLNYTDPAVGLASEDMEAMLHLQLAGWEIWYNPEMHVQHYLPSHRFEREYLLSRIKCIGLSRHHIRMLRWRRWQRPVISPVYLLSDLAKLLGHIFRYRLKVRENLPLACERQLLASSCLSPLFLMWK